MKQRLLLVVLALVGLCANLLALAWLIPAIVFAPHGRRAWKIIISYDMLANASTGGDAGETISARAYQASLHGNRYGCWLCRWLDWLQPDHCKNSIR